MCHSVPERAEVQLCVPNVNPNSQQPIGRQNWQPEAQSVPISFQLPSNLNGDMRLGHVVHNDIIAIITGRRSLHGL